MCIRDSFSTGATFETTFGGQRDFDARLRLLKNVRQSLLGLSLIHISEPTRLLSISYAVFCLKKKNTFHIRYGGTIGCIIDQTKRTRTG